MASCVLQKELKVMRVKLAQSCLTHVGLEPWKQLKKSLVVLHSWMLQDEATNAPSLTQFVVGVFDPKHDS